MKKENFQRCTKTQWFSRPSKMFSGARKKGFAWQNFAKEIKINL
jgi:hypothetical protein